MKRFAALALAAVTLVGAFAVSAGEAEARRWHRGHGVALGLGIIGVGIAAGIAHAASPQYVRRCHFVERYDRNGYYRGTRRVCAVVPY